MQGIIKMNTEPLFFDIETLPTTDKQVIERIAANISPPGNIRKKESIDAWMEENYEQELKKEIHKTGLNAAYGSVACIGFTTDSLWCATTKIMDETQCIKSFYECIEDYEVFSGHNIAGFDLKFLKQRSMILGIKPPKNILKAMNAKPWDDCIKDIMLMWEPDKSKMAGLKLDLMCWWFGVKHDMPDMDGSMVADVWYENPQKVIDYCIADVKAEREIYYKMMFETPVF